MIRKELDPRARFEKFLETVKIGDPIGSLFNPTFEVWFDMISDSHVVKVHIMAPDALGNAPKPIRVSLGQTLPPQLTWPETDQRVYDKMAAKFIRDALQSIISHEVDESILIDDCRVVDPHKEDPA